MYLTNSLRQRFISKMANVLSIVQQGRQDIEQTIIHLKEDKWQKNLLQECYNFRTEDKEFYIRNSALQAHVKRGFIDHRTLQEMEKVVTLWINLQQDKAQYAYEDYLDNRYDPFYRNRSKQAKQKLAKLVELQQAIRKQKRITRT